MNNYDVFYQLNVDHGSFPKGTILLKGDFCEGPINTDNPTGQEWFNLSTELTTGHSYSEYNIPEEKLIHLPESVSKVLRDWFDTFYKGNYAPKPEWRKTA